MDAIGALRRFLEQQLEASTDAVREFGLGETISSQQFVSHLVEQTVRRAAADAAAHRRSLDAEPGPSPADISWKHCLMVAALTELRSWKLSARSRI